VTARAVRPNALTTYDRNDETVRLDDGNVNGAPRGRSQRGCVEVGERPVDGPLADA
jgi:hypothetical protein